MQQTNNKAINLNGKTSVKYIHAPNCTMHSNTLISDNRVIIDKTSSTPYSTS